MALAAHALTLRPTATATRPLLPQPQQRMLLDSPRMSPPTTTTAAPSGPRRHRRSRRQTMKVAASSSTGHGVPEYTVRGIGVPAYSVPTYASPPSYQCEPCDEVAAMRPRRAKHLENMDAEEVLEEDKDDAVEVNRPWWNYQEPVMYTAPHSYTSPHPYFGPHSYSLVTATHFTTVAAEEEEEDRDHGVPQYEVHSVHVPRYGIPHYASPPRYQCEPCDEVASMRPRRAKHLENMDAEEVLEEDKDDVVEVNRPWWNYQEPVMYTAPHSYTSPHPYFGPHSYSLVTATHFTTVAAEEEEEDRDHGVPQYEVHSVHVPRYGIPHYASPPRYQCEPCDEVASIRPRRAKHLENLDAEEVLEEDKDDAVEVNRPWWNYQEPVMYTAPHSYMSPHPYHGPHAYGLAAINDALMAARAGVAAEEANHVPRYSVPGVGVPRYGIPHYASPPRYQCEPCDEVASMRPRRAKHLENMDVEEVLEEDKDDAVEVNRPWWNYQEPVMYTAPHSFTTPHPYSGPHPYGPSSAPA